MDHEIKEITPTSDTEKSRKAAATKRYNSSAKGKACRMRYYLTPKGRAAKRRAAAKETSSAYADRIIATVEARDDYLNSIDDYYTDRLW